MDPLIKFSEWYKEELKVSKDKIPSACCLSTIGIDGYPNARFVSLKKVTNNSLIVTGPLNSRKAMEIFSVPKVALIFWWSATERQVRLQGNAYKIENAEADKYFKERNRESCIVSWASKQGEVLENINELTENYNSIELKYKDKNIPRPENWGGFAIVPLRMEFLEFKSTRFHERLLYTKNESVWQKHLLQP